MSSTHPNTKREAADFYPTPWDAFAPLLSVLPKRVRYHDPACGDGRLVHWLVKSERFASGSDLHRVSKREAGDDMAQDFPSGVDYLTDCLDREFIITNPPFALAFEFCDHALKHSRETMLLLRLNFLGSRKRADWWKQNEPSAIFVLSQRPRFVHGRSDSCDYGWFYWGRRFQGIRHI